MISEPSPSNVNNIIRTSDGWGSVWVGKKPSKAFTKGGRARNDADKFPPGAVTALATSGGVLVSLPPWVTMRVASTNVEIIVRSISLDGKTDNSVLKRKIPVAHGVDAPGVKCFVSCS